MIFVKFTVTFLAVLLLIVRGSPIDKNEERFIDDFPYPYDDESSSIGLAEDEENEPAKRSQELFVNPSVNQNEVDDQEANLSPTESKRSALRFAIARRSHSVKSGHSIGDIDAHQRKDKLIPALSVGAMMNLRDFFDGLKSNVNMLESQSVTPEEFKALHSSLTASPVESFRSVSQYVEDSHIRPTANAAYLHAIRMYRPSHRVRALVATQPELYRGANNYNPSYLWTGLG